MPKCVFCLPPPAHHEPSKMLWSPLISKYFIHPGHNCCQLPKGFILRTYISISLVKTNCFSYGYLYYTVLAMYYNSVVIVWLVDLEAMPQSSISELLSLALAGIFRSCCLISLLCSVFCSKFAESPVSDPGPL